MRAQARVGTVLRKKWRLDVLLGVGGMAAVYAATHRNKQRVAIKILHPELLLHADVRRRFLRESYASNSVGHQGCVTMLYDDTADDGSLFIVMELLDGETLEDRRMRSGGRLDENEVLSVADRVLDVLAVAHEKGIVHRDLKPENLFVTRDGLVKILDFGIARLKETSPQGNATKTGATMGTPAYMPPEQARGLWSEVDGRSDLWAVGATMFTLLSGRYVHDEGTQQEHMLAAMTKNAPPLAAVLPGVAPSIAEVVDRALAFKKEDRWPDAATMQQAVRHAYHDRHGAALEAAPRLTVPPSVPNRTLPGSGGGVALPNVPSFVAFAGRYRPLLAVLAGAGLLGLAGVSVALALKARHRQSTAAAGTLPDDAVVACPPLQSGPDTAWLGAAAAGLACERIRVLQGGRTSRVLVPAELLGLPREAVDNFPIDPFNAPGVRDRSVQAAKANADVWLDGTADKASDGLHVELVMRSKSGAELGRGSATQPLLLDAVHDAVEVLRARGALPGPGNATPFVSDWYGAGSEDGALAVLDFSEAYQLMGDNKRVEAACAAAKANDQIVPAARAYIDCICSMIRTGKGPDGLQFDGTSPGHATFTAAALSTCSNQDDDAADKKTAARVAELLVKEQTPEGRAALACVAAILPPYTDDEDRQSAQVLAAMRIDPKAYTPGCDYALLLVFFGRSTSVMAAASAWRPWRSGLHVKIAEREGNPERRLEEQRRAYTLSPNGGAAEKFAYSLVMAGLPDEARFVAAAAGQPRMQVLLPMVEARFSAALQQASSIVDSAPDSRIGAIAAVSASFGAVEASLVIGRPVAVAEPIVRRFVEQDILPHLQMMAVQTVTLCAFATQQVAARCFARLRDPKFGGFGGTVTAGFAALTDGAERYARHDWRGAATAWRPLVGIPAYLESPIRHALADAFDRSGDPELAERVDASVLAQAHGPFNGADLAYVRAARRARARGDAARAAELARKVVDAWSVADTDVPAVREMRRLLR